MNYFVNNIRINKLLHLQDFDIRIPNEKAPHLIITGKNGSGKTILLNAMAEFIENLCGEGMKNLLHYKKWSGYDANTEQFGDPGVNDRCGIVEYCARKIEQASEKIEIGFLDIYQVFEEYKRGEFVFAFYESYRKPQMIEPVNPEKPNIGQPFGIKKTATKEFLKYLSDLKIQEALARNEGLLHDADNVKAWFEAFEKLLCEIYQDHDLKLEFNYKDYSFRIITEGKSFKFTELSDGFAAIIEIVSDLILKMQQENRLTRSYAKRGVVLIDEIETHLHLALQRLALPMLTKVFPNVQFIVTTHSPFVLNSLSNAVAFDLQQRETIGDLTRYSYEALAEGYFGVRTESSYAQLKVDELKKLLEKPEMGEEDRLSATSIIDDFMKIPESVSPVLKGEVYQLMIKHSDVVKRLQHDKGV